MADSWDSWFGESGYQPSGMLDSSWQFTMPQQGDLMQWNPNQTSAALTDLFGLGSIGAASGWGPMGPAAGGAATGLPMPSPTPNRLPVPGAGAGGAPTPNRGTPNWGLELLKKNPGALLSLLGAGGAGIAGAIKGSQRAQLPGEVRDLATRATAPATPDPYAEAELDRQMRRDIGPGWETSTPGIQAKAYAANLRQQGDRAAAQGGLGTIGSLYNQQAAQKSQEQQSLWQLATLLGVMGLGGIGRSG